MSTTDLDPGLATAALDALPLPAAVLNEHGVVVAVNQAWREEGHPAALGQPYTPQGPAELQKSLEQVLTGQRDQATLDYVRPSTGSDTQLQTIIKRFKTDQQAGLLVTHQTLKPPAQRAAAAPLTEQLYRGIIEDQVEMICRFTPDTTLTFVNESYCRHFDRPREDLIGRRFLDFVPPEAREDILSSLAQLTPEQPTQSYAHPVNLPDGSTGWQHWTDRALFNEQGQLTEFQSVGRDITELKQAEAAQASSEQRFRELAESVPEVFWVFNWEKRAIEYVSPAFQGVFGQPVGDLYDAADTWIRCVHPDDRDRVNRAFRGADLKPFEQRYRVVHPDGDVRWVRDRGRAVTDGQGQVIRVVGIAEDITEQVESNERLRRSEDRYRASLEGALDAFYLLEADRDTDGNITDFVFVDVNEVGARLVSRSRDEVVGQRLCELLPVNRTGGFFDRYVSVTETHEPIMAEFSIDAQGEGIQAAWMQHQVVPVGDGVAIIARDISERKAAEHQIASLYEQTQLILDAVPAYIYYKDADNNILRVNRTAAESIGLPAEQIEGRPTEDFFPEQAAAYYKNDVEVMQSGVPKLGYVESYDVPGQDTRVVQTDKVPVLDKHGRAAGIIVIATDVTDKRRAELDRAVLEKAEEERQLIGRELHDGLGQQITGLRMLLEGCRRKTARGEVLDSDTVGELARIISEANSEVRRLISGLTPEPIAAEELPASLHSIAANLATFYQVNAEARCDDAPSGLTDVQADHLLRIAQEAAHNAAKHANAQRVDVTLQNNGTQLSLVIQDDGDGLRESTTETLVGGRGLRIMRHRADMIRGKFSLYTGKERGTRVEVTVPLVNP